jgi:hypothetical protein
MSACAYQLARAPDLFRIQADIAAATIAGLSLRGCRWDGGASVLVLEFAEEVDAWARVRIDAIVAGLPRGRATLSPGPGLARWQQVGGSIGWAELPFTPSAVAISNVAANGLSTPIVTEVTARGFVYSVSSLGSGDNLGAIEIAFDWEVCA